MIPLTAMDGMEVLSRLPDSVSQKDRNTLYVLLQRLDVLETLRDKEDFQERLALADKRDEEIRRAT